MGLFMKVSGRTTCTTAEENFTTQAVTSTKVNSWTTWLKALVSIGTPMEANTLAIGTRTSSTDSAKRNGMIQVCTRDSTRMPAKKDRVNTYGPMAINTSVNGLLICLTAEDSLSGTTTDFS